MTAKLFISTIARKSRGIKYFSSIYSSQTQAYSHKATALSFKDINMDYTRGLLALPAIKNIEEIILGLPNPMELTKGSYKNLEFRFQNNVTTIIHKGIDIKEFSHIWLSSRWGTRDLAFATKLYLDKFHTPHTFVEKVTSKITDQVKFSLADISIPNTFYVNSKSLTKYLPTIELVCGYPLIIKTITGAHGKDSMYVENQGELLEKLASLPKRKKYLFQSYIPNDYDWGILVSNGIIMSGERSYPTNGEFRNNCNGAREEFVHINDIPDEIKDIALQASKALGLSWSRSDIVVDKNTSKAYLMEVNRCPGISSGTREVFGAQNFLGTHIKMNSSK